MIGDYYYFWVDYCLYFLVCWIGCCVWVGIFLGVVGGNDGFVGFEEVVYCD